MNQDDEGEMEEEHLGINFNVRSPQSTQGKVYYLLRGYSQVLVCCRHNKSSNYCSGF